MKENVEAIYPLAPAQEGMLFHSLLAPESGVYLQQLSYFLRGKVDLNAIRRAWETVIARHAVLRTFLMWERLERPLQIVNKRVKLPWEELDLRGLPSHIQERRIQAFLEADRRRGFDFKRR
jgi:condensation domain-containing protein